MDWSEISVDSREKIDAAFVRKAFKINEDGKDICVVKTEDNIFGISNSCPHAGAQLHHGHCNKLGVISCPLHGYKFYMQNGRSADGNNYKLTTYEFKIEDEKMYIRKKY